MNDALNKPQDQDDHNDSESDTPNAIDTAQDQVPQEDIEESKIQNGEEKEEI